MTDTNEDPLAELLVDAGEVDKVAVVDALRGKVAIDGKSGGLVLQPSYGKLDARRKVLAVLLARKAARLLGVLEEEAFTNKEVAEATGLAPGTAAPSLKSLRELRLVGQDKNKAYLIPNPQLLPAVAFLKGDEL